VSGVNEANGLGAVDYLGERVMEERVLDVELVHRSTLETIKVSTVRTVAASTTGLKISL
jgi:hypothetical protein